MLSNGLADAGITPTDQDLQAIAENKIPTSLLVNEINGNDKYSQLLSKQILDKFTCIKVGELTIVCSPGWSRVNNNVLPS